MTLHAGPLCAALLVAAVALASCQGRVGEGGDCPANFRPNTPSGYCVPRWLSLKRDEVFGRKGPGRDYPTVFVYRALGLPVQVVDETTDWRKICDPDGGEAWVAGAMLDGRRMAMNVAAAPVAMRREPSDRSAADAYLRVRALAAVKGCRGNWCELAADGADGWVRATEVWGLAVQPQCR